MSVIAALNVNLTAKTDGFDAAFKGSGMTLKQWKREAVSVFEATRTPQEAYNKRILEHGKLLRAGLIDKETFVRAVRQEKAALDAVNPALAQHNALMARGSQMTAAMMTATERYTATAREISDLHAAGAITTETRTRALAAATEAFDLANGTTQAAEEAAAAHAETMQDGQQVIEAMRTPLERHAVQIQRLNRLHEQGAIDTETWRRAIRHADATLAAATPRVQRFGERFREAWTNVRQSVAANVVAVIGIRELIRAVGDGLAAVDNLNDVALRVGSTTQQLAALHVAAKLNASSAEDIDSALSVLNKNLAKGEDNPAVAHALNAIGLSSERLRSAGAAQAFVEISEGLKQIENPAERARIAAELFGKSGVELLNVLDLGRDGFEAAANQAEAFGLAISSVDAKNASEAADAIDSIKLSMDGLSQQAAVTFAPIIEWLANAIPIGIKYSQIGFLTFSQLLVSEIGTILKAVALLPDWLGGGVASDWAQYTDILVDELEHKKNDIHKQIDTLEAQGKGRKNDTFAANPSTAADTQAAAAEGLKNLTKDIKGFFSFATELADRAQKEAAKQGVAKLQKDAKGFVDFFKAAKNKGDDFLRDKAKSAIEAAQTPLEKFERTLNDLQALKNVGAIDERTFDRNKLAALEDLDKSTENKHVPISALERGSAAAFSAIQANKPPKTEQEILEQAKHASTQRDEMIAAFKANQPQTSGARR